MSVFLVGLAVSAFAAEGDLHELRVAPPASPTEVEVGVHLVGLTSVSAANVAFPTFTAEVLLDVRWSDPRLAFEPAEVGTSLEVFQGRHAADVLARIWWPDLLVENEEGARVVEHRDVEIRADGRVEVKERFQVTAHADVDLRKFPFDHQDFELRLASFAWDAQRVRLRVDPKRTGFDASHHTLEWTVDGVTATVLEEPRMRLEQPVSVMRVVIAADRIPGFYLYKLLVPLTVIVVFTWSAFWMTAEPSPGRMQRTFVALLTVVAFHHIVAAHLPRISYLTFVDAVVYTSFASVGWTLVTIIRIHNAEQRGEVAKARRIELAARWLQPVGFWLVILALWLLYHL